MHFKVLCTILVGLIAVHLSQGDRYGKRKGRCCFFCYMKPNGTDSDGVQGKIIFKQKGRDEPMRIYGNITGLTPGYHGFHIHESTIKPNDSACTSAGAHFNPYEVNHGGPNDTVRHVGDLGNILADSDGNAKIHLTDRVISCYGKRSLYGHSCVIHQDVDDLGHGEGDSKNTGNSGPRVACGSIRKCGIFRHHLPTTKKAPIK